MPATLPGSNRTYRKILHSSARSPLHVSAPFCQEVEDSYNFPSTAAVVAISRTEGIESLPLKVELESGDVMSVLWPDPRLEMQSRMLREITARLLVETDPNELHKLIEQLTSIVEAQLRTRPPN